MGMREACLFFSYIRKPCDQSGPSHIKKSTFRDLVVRWFSLDGIPMLSIFIFAIRKKALDESIEIWRHIGG